MPTIIMNNSFVLWKKIEYSGIHLSLSETSNFTSAKINFNFPLIQWQARHICILNQSINQFPYALTHREISFCHVWNGHARWKQAQREPMCIPYFFRSVLNFSWAYDAIVSSKIPSGVTGSSVRPFHGSSRRNASANKDIMNFPKVICMNQRWLDVVISINQRSTNK